MYIKVAGICVCPVWFINELTVVLKFWMKHLWFWRWGQEICLEIGTLPKKLKHISFLRYLEKCCETFLTIFFNNRRKYHWEKIITCHGRTQGWSPSSTCLPYPFSRPWRTRACHRSWQRRRGWSSRPGWSERSRWPHRPSQTPRTKKIKYKLWSGQTKEQ